MTRTMIMNQMSFSGLVMRMMIPEGTAPMMGPKTGMMLVRAQMEAMRRLYSEMRQTDRAIYNMIPTARASTSTPLKKPPKVLSTSSTISVSLSSCLSFRYAARNLLSWAMRFSLEERM